MCADLTLVLTVKLLVIYNIFCSLLSHVFLTLSDSEALISVVLWKQVKSLYFKIVENVFVDCRFYVNIFYFFKTRYFGLANLSHLCHLTVGLTRKLK